MSGKIYRNVGQVAPEHLEEAEELLKARGFAVSSCEVQPSDGDTVFDVTVWTDDTSVRNRAHRLLVDAGLAPKWPEWYGPDVQHRWIKIDGGIVIPEGVTHDEFMARFLGWLESIGCGFTGFTDDITDEEEQDA